VLCSLRFASSFRIPNSEFNCICLLLLCYQLVAVLHVSVADHDIWIYRGLF
jgi:hypothetical protein